MRISRVAYSSIAFTIALAPLAALAAETAGKTVEEIFVTAEKREASAQKTSIAMNAFDQDDLDVRGVGDIESLQFAVPNMVISENAQSPVSYAYIRGIGSDQLVAGFDPGVAYNVDGIYIGQPSSMPIDLWDLERVEVLRGPQGTLYGRNTTGGSINVITANPSDKFGAKFDMTGGSFDYYGARAMVTGPINDNVAGRLTAIIDNDQGYQDNKIGPNADRKADWALRGKLAFDIGENGTLIVTAQHFENDGNMGQKRKEPFTDAPTPVYVGAIPNPKDPHDVAKDHNENLDLKNSLFSAILTEDLGFANFVSTTSYIVNTWEQTMDIDMSSNPIQFQNWEMDTNQWTQEFQLISTGTGPMQWILGAFYFNEHLDTDYFFTDMSPFGFQFYNGGDIGTESKALYGQVSYDLREGGGAPIRFTGGARYTMDQKEINEYQRIPAFGLAFAGSTDKHWGEWTGKFNVDWFVNDDVLSYASYSRGYKGGGFSIGQFDTYDPEKVNAYEIGVKSKLWGGRATWNTSVFYYDYKDLQVNFLVFTVFTTNNAGAATIKGVESEGTVLVTDSLTLAGNVNFLSAEYDKYQFDANTDLSGETLDRAPKWSTNWSAQYDFPLGQAGKLSARAQFWWQDSMYMRPQNTARHRVDAQQATDASLMWTSGDEKWLVDAFVKNLTDEENIRGMTISDGLSTGNNTFLSYFPPRTFGVRVGYSLGGS